MNILVLNGSPRPKGNTAFLVDAFAKGATEAGHSVNVIRLSSKKINPCIACNFCRTKGNGQCSQKDDMTEVYEALAHADMVVLASPVYYWSFSGQMQSTITRFFATTRPNPNKYAMILSSGSPNVYDAPISQFKSVMGYFGAENCGIFTFNGEDQKSQANADAMFNFGAGLK